MRHRNGLWLIPQFAILLAVLPAVAWSCKGNNVSPLQTLPASTVPQTKTEQSEAKRVITIGNLTDLTGVAANAMSLVNMALEDLVGYYNDHELIPGTALNVITYDEQFDPAKDIAGYEWLIARDADMIFTPFPSTTATLRSRIEEDGMVLFTLAPSKEGLLPPGRAFCPGNTFGQNSIYTLLDWIARNDPNFPADRPAKIGGAYWAEEYGKQVLGGAEQYSAAHPSQYEWVRGYLTDFKFTWLTEVEGLNECDYILPPVPMNRFVQDCRTADHNTRYIGTDAHLAFLGMIDDANLWKEIDEMLIVQPPWWWNEESMIVDLARDLLHQDHPDKADDIIHRGNGYLSIIPIYVMLEVVEKAVQNVGPDNFDSNALYETASSFSMTLDGYHYSFNDGKRTGINSLGIYRVNASKREIIRVDPEWQPIVQEP